MPVESAPSPQYIGDGVYVALERGMFVLRTGSYLPMDSENEIWLEPEVVRGLLGYISKWRD